MKPHVKLYRLLNKYIKTTEHAQENVQKLTHAGNAHDRLPLWRIESDAGVHNRREG